MVAWKTVKLSEVCEIQRGGSPRPIENFITDAEDGINWIKIGDVAKGAKYITSTREKIRHEGAQRSRTVSEGDFLLSNSMSFGRPYILRTSGCIHDGWLVLRYDKNQLTEDYLYHVLSSDFVYAQFVKFAVGAVVKNLNSEVVKSVTISLPPLPEQRRIAAILDQADILRAKRREALEQLDSLTQSIFIEMFGDPASSSAGWSSVQLSDVAEIVTGYAFRSDEYVDGGEESVRLCRGANVAPGRLDWSDLACWPNNKTDDLSLFQLSVGDIVVAMDRPWISGGFKIAQITERDCPSLLVQRVARIRGKPGVANTYLYHLLNHPMFTGYCRPTETTVPHISPIEIRSFRFYLPPETVQENFVKCIDALQKVKSGCRQSLTELDTLFASLQHRAFRGKL